MNPSDSEQNDNNDPQAERPVATFSPTSEPSSDSPPTVNLLYDIVILDRQK